MSPCTCEGPSRQRAAVCSWREASPSNRWPWTHSIHGGRVRNPARVHISGTFLRAERAGEDP